MIAPFIVLLIAWAMATRVELFGDAVQSLIKVLPYVIALLALFMSVWFQNSNSFFLVCFILFTYILMNIAESKPPMLYEVVTFISILLPLNAVWLGFSKERGVVSSYGRNKAIIVLVQIIWVFINMMGKSSVPVTTGINKAVISLNAPAVVLFIISICILLASYILKDQYLNLIFVAVLLTSYISLHFAHRTPLVAVFTTAIFVIVVIALLDMSYSLAFYDTLTGVLSRRALEQELLKLRSRYAIAMVDLDHFKHINDKYGHDVGDEVLKMVASILNKASGRAKVFRYGGEEFVVLFSGMPYNDIMQQLEHMRKAIERRPFFLRAANRPKEKPKKISNPADKSKETASSYAKSKETVNITVSIGVAQKNDLLKTYHDVIRKADEALYKSKNNGRNCVSKI